ncbi:MAG: 4Fe-4S dicluster domain-containing protein [Verrucomicrobia bacterium]|nr:4Fe-4S dicluster domain-containing protein [Verrucomicrobiota bacterium]MBU4247057.1 4Fe-4S dicluster domain-containing protein [Verrucomicrobiota bacterium]MBU4291131.1 4Fe-4S dicluster domain-containing protein [Verrucomicrobiota bacterium]MBU4498168.1 4Fe-4S dicluster domain-containing protein [Verrucomicrobiota bacterium]MCG2680148.1 4Fe-4S dicluster domain-containing protein [Kiritimatiellia bacterium]
MSFRLTIDIDRCKGCELCIEVCPRHTLAMSATLNTSGVHFPQINPAHDCLGCRQCAILCPEAALEIEKITERPPSRIATRRTRKSRTT